MVNGQHPDLGSITCNCIKLHPIYYMLPTLQQEAALWELPATSLPTLTNQEL